MTVLSPFATVEGMTAWGQILTDDKVPFPGIVVSVSGAKRPIEWLVQNGIGLTGASLVYKGKKLVEGMTIVCELLNETHWREWETHYAYIKVADGTIPKKHTIKHPAFSNLRQQVFSEYPESPEYAGKRKWTVTYVLKEYRKPVPVPTGQPDPAKVDGPPKPKDALESALNGILQKVNDANKD